MPSALGMSSLHPQSIYTQLKESCSDDEDEPPPPPPPMLPPPLLHCARSSSDDIERRAGSPDKLSQERSTHAFDLIRLQHPSCSTLEGSERSRTARHSAGSSDPSVGPSGGAPASVEGHSSRPPSSPRKASTLGELPSPQAMKLTQRNLEFHRLKHTALHSPPASSHGHREGTPSRKPGHSRSKSVDPWLLKGAKLMRMFEGRPGDGADSEDDKSECSSNCAVGSALSIGSALFAGLGSIAKARYLGSKDGGKRAKEVWSELAPHADALKESAQTAAASKLHSVVGNELGNFLRTLGKKGREMVIEEDYLPGWFRAMGLRMFENIWPQIEREMHDILMQQLGRQLNVRPEVFKQEAEPARWKPNVAVYLRSKLRYTLYPYDKSVFQVVRNPWCVVLMICSVFPYFGIQPMYYLVVFCCIDKSDEFQLVAFVLEIKAFSCFTIGYLLLILGAAQDHLCITWLTEPLCDEFGPGVSPAFAWELLGFVLQTLLFFVGFLCLPFSSSRTEDPNSYSESEAVERHREVLDLLGANKDHYLITKKPTGICLKLFDCMFPGGDYSRGGMLYPWMVYDASVLFLTILLAVFFINHGARIDEEFWQDQWRLHAIIWWWKTCYGLLETPFLIFTVTRMSSFLTYAQPTGYDRQGKLVRQLTRAERRQRYDDLQQEFQVGSNQSKASPMPARSQSHGCTRSPSVCRSAKQWSDSFAPLLAGKSEAGKWRDKHSTSTSSRLNMLARKGLSILLSHLPPREGMGDDVRGSRDDSQTGSSAIDERPHEGKMSNRSGLNLTPVDKLNQPNKDGLERSPIKRSLPLTNTPTSTSAAPKSSQLRRPSLSWPSRSQRSKPVSHVLPGWTTETNVSVSSGASLKRMGGSPPPTSVVDQGAALDDPRGHSSSSSDSQPPPPPPPLPPPEACCSFESSSCRSSLAHRPATRTGRSPTRRTDPKRATPSDTSRPPAIATPTSKTSSKLKSSGTILATANRQHLESPPQQRTPSRLLSPGGPALSNSRIGQIPPPKVSDPAIQRTDQPSSERLAQLCSKFGTI